MTLERIRNWYEKLPRSELDLPLVIVDGMAYSPRAVLAEVQKGTPLGNKMQGKVEMGTFSQEGEARELAKIRLKKVLEKKLDEPLVATYALGEKVTFTGRELMEEIQKETKVGKQWVEAEEAHMKRMIRK